MPNKRKVVFQFFSSAGGYTTKIFVFSDPLAIRKRFAIIAATTVFPKPTTSAKKKPLCSISIWNPWFTASI